MLRLKYSINVDLYNDSLDELLARALQVNPEKIYLIGSWPYGEEKLKQIGFAVEVLPPGSVVSNQVIEITPSKSGSDIISLDDVLLVQASKGVPIHIDLKSISSMADSAIHLDLIRRLNAKSGQPVTVIYS